MQSAAAPTVRLPLRPSISFERATTRVDLPLVGPGTGTIPQHRVTAAVTMFLQMGGRHLDTAAMYENYAEIRTGIESSGLQDPSQVVITFKMMPLGRAAVNNIVAEAMAGLGVKYLDIA